MDVWGSDASLEALAAGSLVGPLEARRRSTGIEKEGRGRKGGKGGNRRIGGQKGKGAEDAE